MLAQPQGGRGCMEGGGNATQVHACKYMWQQYYVPTALQGFCACPSHQAQLPPSSVSFGRNEFDAVHG